jgi:hypothetical protein
MLRVVAKVDPPFLELKSTLTVMVLASMAMLVLTTLAEALELAVRYHMLSAPASAKSGRGAAITMKRRSGLLVESCWLLLELASVFAAPIISTTSTGPGQREEAVKLFHKV